MNLGDVVESAIWITGEESQEIRKRYEVDVTQAIDDLCKEMHYVRGPIVWFEKVPGTNRVPEVPDHIQGIRVRLLVAEAEIVGLAPVAGNDSFIANLDKKDLVRLRHLTRKGAVNGTKQNISDKECDEIIDKLGPEVIVGMLRNTLH